MDSSLEGAHMLMADVFSIGLSIIGFLAAMQGLWLLCRAMWPARFARGVARSERGLMMPAIVGAAVTGGMVLLIVMLNALGGVGQAMAFTVFGIYLVYSAIGTAALVTMLGKRLPSPVDELCPWRATVRGGAAMELAWLIPVIGWFGLLPLSIVLGAGLATMTFFARKPAACANGQHVEAERLPLARHELLEVG